MAVWINSWPVNADVCINIDIKIKGVPAENCIDIDIDLTDAYGGINKYRLKPKGGEI
jgi:hypothetical protein